jgi:predicted AAA+ superfamily ATPase
MLQTFPNTKINQLSETTFIAGTYKELVFYVNDSEGNPLDVTYFVCTWSLNPYNDKSFISLQKNAQCFNGFFIVYLTSEDTENLSGKFLQIGKIYIIGSYAYNIAQGVVNILPKLGRDNYG